MTTATFSRRHGLRTPALEITVRDAPHELRGVVVEMAYECGLGPRDMREIVCRTLRVREDPTNWSPPNIDGEVKEHFDSCDWPKVYDLIEATHRALIGYDQRNHQSGASRFERELNDYFVDRGIGWQLRDGLIEVRGSEAFQGALATARAGLTASARPTAQRELEEAVQALSRRPQADLTGALQHAFAAVECVARDVTGDSRATLGQLLARNKQIVPPPVDQALDKLWGFASERGRHLREGGDPAAKEVVLVVHVAAAVIGYLVPSQSEAPRES